MPDDRDAQPAPDWPQFHLPHDPVYGVLDTLLALDPHDAEASAGLRLTCCHRCAAMATVPELTEEACRAVCDGEGCGLRDPQRLAAAQRWVWTCREWFAHPELASAEDYAALANDLYATRSYIFTIAPGPSGYLEPSYLAPTLVGMIAVNMVMEIATRAGVVFFGNVRAMSGQEAKRAQEEFRALVETHLDRSAAQAVPQLGVSEVARRQRRDRKTVDKAAKNPGALRRRRPRGRRPKGGS